MLRCSVHKLETVKEMLRNIDKISVKIWQKQKGNLECWKQKLQAFMEARTRLQRVIPGLQAAVIGFGTTKLAVHQRRPELYGSNCRR